MHAHTGEALSRELDFIDFLSSINSGRNVQRDSSMGKYYRSEFCTLKLF